MGERFQNRRCVRLRYAQSRQSPHRFTPQVDTGVSEQGRPQRGIEVPEFLQRPQRADAHIDRRLLIAKHRHQVRNNGLVLTLGHLVPRRAHRPSAVGFQRGREFLRRHLRVVGDRSLWLASGTHPPDPTVPLVPRRMIPSDFVVRDDAVVPVRDVEAAIGTEGGGDGTKHGIVTAHENTGAEKLPNPILVLLTFDGMDLAQHRIGDEKHPLP